MTRIIFIVISGCLLLIGGCKKCYTCSNGCCKQVSTNTLICTTDFASVDDFEHVIDSLQNDIDCGGLNSFGNFSKKICNEADVIEYEAMQGISCRPLND